jgi:hypothetical protein
VGVEYDMEARGGGGGDVDGGHLGVMIFCSSAQKWANVEGAPLGDIVERDKSRLTIMHRGLRYGVLGVRLDGSISARSARRRLQAVAVGARSAACRLQTVCAAA